MLVQFFLFLHYGIKVSVDTAMYIDDAGTLLTGHLPDGRNIWYLGYSFFLSVLFFFGGDEKMVVFFQCVFSGLAAFALYSLVNQMSSNKVIAIISVSLYLAWIKIHQWNMFIYTDSLFASFSIISLALLSGSKKEWQFLGALLVIAFTFFLRPTGICLVTAVVGYFLYRAYAKMSKVGFVVTLIGLCVLSVLLLNFVLKEFVQSIVESYAKAEIIYPNINLGIQKHNDLTIPSTDHAPIIRILLFGFYNPIYFLKITGFKALLFLANVKPYFSLLHNLAIVSVLYPIYAFAFYGIKILSWSGEKIFILCFIVTQTIMVGLTSENWDGRFLVPVLPFVFILASFGIVQRFQSNHLFANHGLKK